MSLRPRAATEPACERNQIGRGRADVDQETCAVRDQPRGQRRECEPVGGGGQLRPAAHFGVRDEIHRQPPRRHRPARQGLDDGVQDGIHTHRLGGIAVAKLGRHGRRDSVAPRQRRRDRRDHARELIRALPDFKRHRPRLTFGVSDLDVRPADIERDP